VSGWQDGSPDDFVQSVIDDLRNNKVHALKQLAPESGAYFNEVSFSPAWIGGF
jgi:hypothetical protein